jgi:hypothetical protein
MVAPTDIAAMENIGRNCEFGLFQNALGSDHLGLLRASATPMSGLIAGLRSRFEGLGEVMSGVPDPPARPPDQQEWWLTCQRYGIQFHSGQRVAATTIPQATANTQRRLRWLAGKFLQDIANGEKLYVRSDATITDPAEVEPLLAAMREIGPAWILVVVDARVCKKFAPGVVACLRHGLIVASANRLTNSGDATAYDRPSWEAVVPGAVGLWRELSALRQETDASPKPLQPNTTPGFDEAWYLWRYPGIAEAVRRGGFESGWVHYQLHGQVEGREPLPPADTD